MGTSLQGEGTIGMGEVKDMFELGMHPVNCLLTAFRGLTTKASINRILKIFNITW